MRLNVTPQVEASKLSQSRTLSRDSLRVSRTLSRLFAHYSDIIRDKAILCRRPAW